MDYKEIVKQMVSDRNALHIYQYEMADVLGVDERTYRKIEKGESKMSLEQYLLLCQKLKKSPSHYLGGNSPVNNGTINGVMNNGEFNLNANNLPADTVRTFQLLIEALAEKMGRS